MNEFQKRLRPGEKVLWQGAPKTFPLLENNVRGAIIRKWVIIAVCVAALLILYLRVNPLPSVPFVVIVLGLGVIIAISPITERQQLKRQEYWITNQRVFVKTGSTTFFYMELSEINEPLALSNRSATTSLVLGDAIRAEAKKQLRWQACHPKTDPEATGDPEHSIGIVLYDIEHSDEALELIRTEHRSKPLAG